MNAVHLFQTIHNGYNGIIKTKRKTYIQRRWAVACMFVWFLHLQLFASFKYNLPYDKFTMRYKLCKLTYDILNISYNIIRLEVRTTWQSCVNWAPEIGCVSPCSRCMHHCSRYLKCADCQTDAIHRDATAACSNAAVERDAAKAALLKSQDGRAANNGISHVITLFCMHQ